MGRSAPSTFHQLYHTLGSAKRKNEGPPKKKVFPFGSLLSHPKEGKESCFQTAFVRASPSQVFPRLGESRQALVRPDVLRPAGSQGRAVRIGRESHVHHAKSLSPCPLFSSIVLTILTFLGLIPCPFCSSIVLSKNRIRFPWVSGGFLERRLPGKNGEGTPRMCKRSSLYVLQS